MNKLYKFKLSKSIEVEKREERGEETVIKKENVIRPVSIILKKPSRREREEMETIEAIAFSRAVQQGIMTRAMMQKAYKDTGGLYSKQEEKEIEKLYEDYEDLQKQIIDPDSPTSEEDPDVLDKLMSLYLSIKNIENKELTVFENCAENKARDVKVQWAVINLLYVDESENGEGVPEPYFKEDSYEEKLEKLDELFESEDSFFVEMWNKVSLIFAYWIINNMEASEEEIDNFFNEYKEEQLDEDSQPEEDENSEEDEEAEKASEKKPLARKVAKKKSK